MRKKPIYIFTENLNFFYQVNKFLTEKKIRFKILNFGNKIPNSPSIILTTLDDVEELEKPNKKVDFLIYSQMDDFNDYILKILATYRIGFKINYSKLTFSIDPGKKIGLMIFLDDFYLDSYCCFEKSELIKTIKTYIDFFHNNNTIILNLNFKLGKGIISITFDLVKTIFNILHKRSNLKVFLIDEFKSSKIKINIKHKDKRISKDEVSALILALRNGIEVKENNYISIFNQLKSKNSKKEDLKSITSESISEQRIPIGKIAEKVLIGEISLNESSEIIKNYDNMNYHLND